MNEVGEAPHVHLSPEQVRRLHDWAATQTVAEVEADCEPYGFHLDIAVGEGFPAFAEAVADVVADVVAAAARLDLGEVDSVPPDEK